MEAHAPQVTHEAERIARVTITLTALWVLLFSAALGVIAVVVFNTRSRFDAPAEGRALPRPRAEVANVRTDLFGAVGEGEARKAAQRRRLSQFEWVDEQHGVIRVPIDVAMELELAEQR
jgi:hypothetical protein